MNELSGDIRVTLPDVIKNRMRLIEVSTGLYPGPDSEYHLPSIIPKSQWRRLSSREFDELTSINSFSSYHNTVALMPVDEQVFTDLSRCHERLLNGELSSDDPVIVKAKSAFYEYCERLNIARYQSFNSITEHHPGQNTVTQHNGRKLGLHIDSFDSVEFRSKAFSTNRLCVNLGCEDRYFLFINVTALTLLRQLRDTSLHDSSSLAHALLKSMPNQRVFRLLCPPGFAYCAPTENMLHDGSTIGMTKPDLSMSVRGYFNPLMTPILSDCSFGDHGVIIIKKREGLGFVDDCNVNINFESINRALYARGLPCSVESCRLLRTIVDPETSNIEFPRGIPEEVGYNERYVLLAASTFAASSWRLSVDGGEGIMIDQSEAVISTRDFLLSISSGNIYRISEYALAIYPSHHDE